MDASQDEDMYLFDPQTYGQTPSAFPTQPFDEFVAGATPRSTDGASPAFMSPSEMASPPAPPQQPIIKTEKMSRPTASPSGSRASSDFKVRNADTIMRTRQSSGAWPGGMKNMALTSGEEAFNNVPMATMDDFDESNRQMATDFDFDTAASAPGFNPLYSTPRQPSWPGPFRASASFSSLAQFRNTSPRLPVNPNQLFLGPSRETSPMNTMLPGQSPWNKNSPSSGLEEGFNGITMNGDSPGNATFNPNLPYTAPGLNFDTESAATPPIFNMTPSPSSEGPRELKIFPTSLKSRVETQIPIKMILNPFPQGVTKLRLPSYTVSKPKFLAKTEAERSPETLELYTSLVCTSAMQDPIKFQRAFARARGEVLSPNPESPAGSNSSKEDEEKPLNGGEVKICAGCIQRERKRASRKKQKKPDEEEMFQKDEDKRVIVFNTNEIKDWTDASKDSAGPPLSKGTMQVELPMRIACYCRHQNEKLGFQVIFTIMDHKDKMVAQAITNSIMITDDHKTHTLPPPGMGNPALTGPRLPGSGVFPSGMDMTGGKIFKQSYSTTDLQGLQYNFNPSYPMSNGFTMSGAGGMGPSSRPQSNSSMPQSSSTSTTVTPRNLSRPASPTGEKGPSKRRKQSGSGKIPSGLTMTRLDTSQPSGSSTAPNTATASTFAPSFDAGPAGFRLSGYETSPPTPNVKDMGMFNKSFSMDNLPRQAMMSAPSSRHPSRPGSAASNKIMSGMEGDPTYGQPVRAAPTIHKVVPATGSVAGGTEVALLGNGFSQGMDVMFGNSEATTTTYWGDKCLQCITPPANGPGTVAVVLKSEQPRFNNALQTQTHTFTYQDDREKEIYRQAMTMLGRRMPQPMDDPYKVAQQIYQDQQQWPWAEYGGRRQ